MNTSLLVQLLINGLIVGALYGVVAMCFTLIYKATQVVNFAQGEFVLVGAWVCWWVVTDLHLSFWVAFPATLIFMFVFGVLIQVVVLRPLLGEPIISVIMVTIGLSIFFHVETVYIMSLIISVLVMGGFAWFFKYSRMGLAMRATAFDQQVAQSLGVSIKQVFALSWAISAVVSTLAGVVIGVVSGVSSALAFIGIKVFPAVIVGGLDSIVGAVVGGLIVGVLENVAQFADSEILHWGNMYTIAPFYVLVVILMIKPYGLFGTEDIERV
jgi:branched-chain amino acid transport system permease protein